MEYLFRGTRRSVFEEDYGDRAALPGNWTDSPLQAVNYAFSKVAGQYREGETIDDPMVIAASLDEEMFEHQGKAMAGVAVFNEYMDERPEWYSFDGELGSVEERDRMIETWDGSELGEFVLDYRTELDRTARNEMDELVTDVEDLMDPVV